MATSGDTAPCCFAIPMPEPTKMKIITFITLPLSAATEVAVDAGERKLLDELPPALLGHGCTQFLKLRNVELARHPRGQTSSQSVRTAQPRIIRDARRKNGYRTIDLTDIKHSIAKPGERAAPMRKIGRRNGATCSSLAHTRYRSEPHLDPARPRCRRTCRSQPPQSAFAAPRRGLALIESRGDHVHRGRLCSHQRFKDFWRT
jgi:hypothetical protein